MCLLKLSAETQHNAPYVSVATQKKKRHESWNDSSLKGVRSFSTPLRSFSIFCILTSFLLGCLTRCYLELLNVSFTSKGVDNVVSIEPNVLTGSPASGVSAYTLLNVESIVHPALLAHPNPLSVLIVGGTKHEAYVQAIFSEVLKHKTVKRVAVLASLMDISSHRELGARETESYAGQKQLEYIESFENLQYLMQSNDSENRHTYDVVILLHPFRLLSTSNTRHHLKNYENLTEFSNFALSKRLSLLHLISQDGILVTHLGPSPYIGRKTNIHLRNSHCNSYNCTKHPQLNLINHLMSHYQFVDVHVYEESEGPEYHLIRLPQSYGIFCKTRNCRRHWYADESYMNYQIRKRLSSSPLVIDGATLQKYIRPPKSWESLFCSFPEHKRKCQYMNGFDPNVPNVMRTSFEVKTSSLGKNIGRGLFTKVDIQEGSYLMQEVAVHQLKFSVQSYSAIFSTKQMLQELIKSTAARNMRNRSDVYDIDSLLSYMDGYGYDDETFGGVANFVDSGLTTFINHGCNKTFNVGSIFYALDQKRGILDSPDAYALLSEEEADANNPPKETKEEREDEDMFDPILDRHFEHDISSYEGSLSYIRQGQELFCNYVHLYGIHDWKRGILELRSQCRGETIGIVVEKEIA